MQGNVKEMKIVKAIHHGGNADVDTGNIPSINLLKKTGYRQVSSSFIIINKSTTALAYHTFIKSIE